MGREIARGFRGLKRAVGGPVLTWKGEEYPCIANEATASRVFGPGGFAFEADLILFVERADLPEVIMVETQEIVYRGRTFRIDHVGDLPGDDQVKLACNDPDSEA